MTSPVTGPLRLPIRFWPLPAMVSMFALLACSEIPFPGVDTPLPECECPILIAEVESIEWVPGVRGRQTSAVGADRDSGPAVVYEFGVADAGAEVERLKDDLVSAGLDVEGTTTGGFYASDAGVTVFVRELEERLRVSVTLEEGATDQEAPQTLQPVKRALGVR